MTTGGMHPHPESLYYHIAKDASDAVQSEADEFRRKQLVATALVFSALCLEAFINQEMAKTQVGDDDRIPLEAKWLWLPLLRGSTNTFEKSREPYQTFRRLVSLRNQRLVHFKPSKETRTTEGEYSKEYFGDFIGDVKLARKSVECVAGMIRELNRLTKGVTEVPPFLTGEKYLSRIWASATVACEVVSSPKGKSSAV